MKYLHCEIFIFCKMKLCEIILNLVCEIVHQVCEILNNENLKVREILHNEKM